MKKEKPVRFLNDFCCFSVDSLLFFDCFSTVFRLNLVFVDAGRGIGLL